MSKTVRYSVISVFVILSLLDLLTTWVFLEFRITTEANPLAADLLTRQGFGGLILFKIVGVTFISMVILFLSKYHSMVVSVIAIAGTAFAVIYNSLIILKGVGLLG